MKDRRGSALLVVMTFLLIMGMLFLGNAAAIGRLRGYLRHVERRHLERIVAPGLLARSSEASAEAVVEDREGNAPPVASTGRTQPPGSRSARARDLDPAGAAITGSTDAPEPGQP